MSTNDDTRTLGLQLPLPMLDADPAPGPVAVPDLDPRADARTDDERTDDERGDAGWRLDEHTRQVGRRGIAEARARLRAGSGRAA
jgi:hypothetical protein